MVTLLVIASTIPWSMKQNSKRRNPHKEPPVTPARSRLMAAVRVQNTAPELLVRKALRSIGVRYSLHPKSLPGRPDICVSSQKLAIFVHGCFWHRHANCRKATSPKTRSGFWTEKFLANVARDKRKTRELRKLGWSVLVIWECQCRDTDRLRSRLTRIVDQLRS